MAGDPDCGVREGAARESSSRDQTPVAPGPPSAFAPEQTEHRGPCLRFIHTGRCRFAACRFHHDEAARQEALAAKQEEAAKAPSRSIASALASAAAGAEPAAGAGSGASKSWRSVDFLLQGESVKTHPYLKEFASAPWLQEMLDMKECDSLLSVSGRRLKKELSESFGVLYACKRAMAKLQTAHGLGAECSSPATLLDLGCGKGFGSLVLAQSMPAAEVVAVDKNPSMELAHFRQSPNIRFLELDITSEAAPATLLEERKELDCNPGDGGAAPLVIVGMHLCGALSNHAIRVFKEAAAPAALILAPCCLDGRRPAVKRKAKKLGIDPHRYWCMNLLMDLPEGCRRELFVDDNVLSAKNSFVIASKAV